jgi:hypothetical protein
MKYQLVIQFPEGLYDDLDEIAELEDRLDEQLLDAEVDGHDIGSGEVNIFIHTNTPAETFEKAKNLMEDKGIDLDIIKAAYRGMDGNEYVPLWPEDLEDFEVV